MGGPESLAGKLIYTARKCRSMRADLLQKHGLHPGQDLLLESLSQTQGQSMGALAEALGVRPPTVTKMVNRMEAGGLVERRNSRYDSRQNHVFITVSGKQMLDRIADTWRQVEENTFAGLKEKDTRRLAKILARVLENLEGRPRQTRGRPRDAEDGIGL